MTKYGNKNDVVRCFSWLLFVLISSTDYPPFATSYHTIPN